MLVKIKVVFKEPKYPDAERQVYEFKMVTFGKNMFETQRMFEKELNENKFVTLGRIVVQSDMVHTLVFEEMKQD